MFQTLYDSWLLKTTVDHSIGKKCNFSNLFSLFVLLVKIRLIPLKLISPVTNHTARPILLILLKNSI